MMKLVLQPLLWAGMLAIAASAQTRPASAPVAVGEKVPEFSVRDLQGRTWKLSELQKQTKGGVVSLTFWCSFCHSCRHIDASVNELAKAQQGKAAVVLVDASAGETAERVQSFAQKKGLTLPILMDAEGKSADLFGVKVTTTTLVIDGSGVLRYRGRFEQNGQALAQEAIAAVAAGKPVATRETQPKG